MPDERLSYSHGEEIDRVADEFESAWRDHGKTSIRDYLPKVTSPARPQLLRELIHLDWDYRRRLGESPSIADYQALFSDASGNADASVLLTPSQWQSLQAELAGIDDRTISRPQGPSTTIPAPQAPRMIPGEPPPGGDLQRIGKYVVTAVLDSGGQAVVCRAVHPTLGGEVAIKLAHDPLDASAARPEALAAEGRILAELQHPGIARVFDLDFHEGRLFLAMEYIRGRNLSQYAKDGIDQKEAARIISAMARALAAAHRAGVLHLDIKPSNIIIDESGRARLIDFGLARISGAWRDDRPDLGVISGTLLYMPPEQARGEGGRLSPRSDLFSLGGVLFFLLTGRAPYETAARESMSQVLERAQQGRIDFSPLRKASIPAKLRAICEKALAIDSAQRYATGDQLADDLDRFIRPRAPKLWLAAGVVAAAVLIVMCTNLGWKWAHPRSGPIAALTSQPPTDPSAITKPLQVQVQRDGNWMDIQHAKGLLDGDHITATASIAAGHYGTMMLFDSSGHSRLLAQVGPDDPVRELRYPPVGQEGGGAVQGKTGTEVIVVCASRAEPIGVDQLKSCWPDSDPWPPLPQGYRVVLQGEIVTTFPKSRDIGDADDPAGEVRQRMQHVGTGLMERFHAAEEAVALPHLKAG